jgi:hypothetical protein
MRCDTEFLSYTNLTFCTARVPLHFCVCNTLHIILTSANDTSDTELPCGCTVVNGLKLASRILRIDYVSPLCYLLLLSESCFNTFYVYKLRHDMKCYLTFLSLYKFVQLSC